MLKRVSVGAMRTAAIGAMLAVSGCGGPAGTDSGDGASASNEPIDYIELHRKQALEADFIPAYFSHFGSFAGDGPEAFMDHRFFLEFENQTDGKVTTVEGYLERLNVDGGSSWAAHLPPLAPGRYELRQLFCQGPKVAIEGCEGELTEEPEPLYVKYDVFRSGVRQGAGRYLQRRDGSVFLKTGAGSPENILAFEGIEGTYSAGGIGFPSLGDSQLHKFEAHRGDAESIPPMRRVPTLDPIMGLFSYYETVGVNSQYLVAMNVHGDGWDVFPWVRHDDPYTYHPLKLARWQTVFEHAQASGVAMNFLFTETENESFFEVHDNMEVGVDFAPSRKLYYREMVARFAHLGNITWNLGEEQGVVGNTGEDPYRQPTSATQRAQFADYIASIDPHGHPIVAHNWPDSEEDSYGPLLGHDSFSGISLQAHHDYFDKVLEWTTRSAEAGRPWTVSVDEPLGWEFGARPDADVDGPRTEIVDVLWPVLLAGGTGVEWYFGWQNNAPTSDLSSEDQRSRDRLWKASAKVRAFFETLPLLDMTSRRDGDTLILEGAGYRLAMTGNDVMFTEPGQQPRPLDPYDPR